LCRFLLSFSPAIFLFQKVDDAGSAVGAVQFGIGEKQTLVTKMAITLFTILGCWAFRMTDTGVSGGVYRGVHNIYPFEWIDHD